ncbi:MAG: DinB family protein [Treponema sp.]|nr:DinB family protein [Treponema sp.]
MDRNEKEGLIVRYETAFEPIRNLVKNLTAHQLSFIPDLPEAWSINEHLVHLLEADLICWYRIRAAIAEPGVTIPVWNQEAWRSRLRYSDLDGIGCLEESVRVRSLIGRTCRGVLDGDWSAFHVIHPERGRMDLAQLLELYSGHGSFHLKYLERNLTACRAR